MNKQPIQYQSTPGLRQDILSFTEDDPRRKRFFICLKMLGILPCHEKNKELQYNINVKIKGGNGEQIDADSMLYTKPQRIHDQLIASHVTCCEHNTPFFPYYHRNLLVYVQMQLNYADQYLRFQSVQGQQQHQDLWRQLMQEYRVIIQEMKAKDIFQEKVMMHYWNPTNYTIDKETQKSVHFPIQLTPKRSVQTIDILFQAINSHYPWNFNFRTRLFSHLSEEEYTKMNIKREMNDFLYFEQYLRYTQEEKLIISGQANPRSNKPQMVRHFFDNYIRRVNGRSSMPINAIISNEVGIRNKEYYQGEGKTETIPLYNLTQDEFALNYGTGTYNMQWLNPAQIKQINSQIKTAKMIPEYYNTLLPHYQFAYAYVKSQKSLISSYLGGAASASSPTDYQKRLQNSHNTMHNNLAFIMSDPNFSLTNLIFFPFHSWIDYQLEVKVRQLSNDPIAYNIAQKQLAFKRQRTVYDIVSKDKGPFTIGTYKLVDWVDPRVGAWRWNSSQSQQAARYYFEKNKLDPLKSFRYSFDNTNFTDFVLDQSQKHIRRSDELNGIYKSQYQTENSINQRFEYFMNLKEYNFNYNYQIYDQGIRIKMDKSVPVLPSYISKIVDVIGGSRQPKVNFSASTKKTAQVLNNSQQKVVQLQSIQQPIFINTFTPLKVKQRLLQNPILALGKHSSLIKSNIYHIQIKFFINKFEHYSNLLTQSDMDYIKSGFLIKSLSVFSKSQASMTCPKCVPYKKFWVDVGDKLRQTFPTIWKVVNLFILQKNKILYSSLKSDHENEQNVLYTSEVIKLVSDPQKFRPFLILEGAQQVQFDVILGSNFSNQQVSVKIQVEVFSMFNQKVQSIMTKTLYSLQQQESLKHFDFYKVMDVASSSAENNFDEFDKYYYKRVKCEIIINQKIQTFSFSIPNYHRLVRYLIKIGYLGQKLNKKEKIFVEIEDRDFQFKKNYYLEWEDDLFE